MRVKFNYREISEMFGASVESEIKGNNDVVLENLKYLAKLGFSELEEIFYRNAIIFLYSNQEFKRRVNDLIKEIGKDYLMVLQSDLEYWTKLY